MSAVSSSSAISSAVSSEIGGSTLGKEDFMLLLVTQFQYQDPLNPMEDKEFIAQLAQFSSLEQMMNMNESMTSLTAATQSQELVNATSYIGKNVDVTGNTISKQTDASGKAVITKMRYALGENMASGTINVVDSNGVVVNTITLPAQSAGTHEFDDWDGTIYGGKEFAGDGVYTLYPQFKNADGEPIVNYDMVVDGLVTGVINDNGIAHLSLSDGRTTPLAGVRRVSLPEEVSTTTPEADDTDPVDPTEPTDPADPTEPTDPADPTDPAEPTDPADPDGGNSGSGTTPDTGDTTTP